MVVIKRENWKGKYIYVAREKGRIITKQRVKGSKFKTKQLKDIFQQQGSFSTKFKVKRQKLTNVELIERTKKTTIEQRNKKIPIKTPSNNAMYSVSGYVNGNLIVANSMKDSYLTPSQKRKNAWKSFLERLSNLTTGEYDADEGLKQIGRVRNLREGWVYYSKI